MKKPTMKTKIYYSFLLLLLFTIYYLPASRHGLLFTNKVFAQHFESDSFQIDWGNFNMTSGNKTSTNYRLSDTVGQNAPGQYDRTGYILKSGFQYIYDTFYQFSFSIDDLSIDFGVLVPSIGSTDSNIITVTSPSGNGYEILVHENHPLSLASGTTIPDTNCNSGCNEYTSGVWTNSSAYGFGLNALGINSSGVTTGIGTSNYFSDSTYFRQFANYAAAETPQVIMSENSPAKSRSARITYKANISPQQAAGNYENAIIFTAIPKY